MKRMNLLAGAILGSALLLGTVGLVMAKDPAATPMPSATSGMSGGMIGGQALMGTMDVDDMSNMTSMRQGMGETGTCDPSLMQSMHQSSTTSR